MNTRSDDIRAHVLMGCFGLLMGVSLSNIGYTDYGEMHKMLTFADLRMLFVFMGGLAITSLGFLIMARGRKFQSKPFHKGSIAGGVLFGIGWAITGSCPGVAVIQLGQGYLGGLATMIGIAMGVWSYRHIHSRFFRWDTGACQV